MPGWPSSGKSCAGLTTGGPRTVLLPKTSSMLVGAIVPVEPMLYAIAPGGALV
jgi:hypothetical protein